MTSILITAIGGDIAQCVATVIRESRPEYRLVGTDIQERHGGTLFVDVFRRIPSSRDPSYLLSLRDLIQRESIKIAIPLSEQELSVLPNFMSQENKIHWISPGKNTINTGLDKLETSMKLAQFGLPVPWTLPSQDGTPKEYPCIFKSRTGSGSKGLFLVRNKDEAHYLAERYPDSIFQELLEPSDKEITCAVYRTRNGQTKSLQMLRRLKGGFTSWAKVINEPSIQKTCEVIAEKLNLRGSMNVQLILTCQGPRVFEINPRYSSTVLMRHQIGFKDVIWALDESEGKTIIFPSLPLGKIMVRTQSAAVLGE